MNERTQRVLLLIVSVLLVVGTSLALRYAGGYHPLVAFSTPPSSLPGDIRIRFENVSIVGRDHQQPVWSVQADRIDTTPSRSHIDFAGHIRADLLKNHVSRAHIIAPFATYQEAIKQLHVNGDIICTVRELKIHAPQLDWYVGSNLIRCPGRSRAIYPQGEISGDNVTLDLNSHNLTLQNTEGHFVVGESVVEEPLKNLREILP